MSDKDFSIGSYLATRLEQAGLKHYFAIPGDYNLLLLDELLKIKNLQMINCCNELNAGYAADGYARAHGLAALVVTYSVGGLSAINAVAGAYAENLPLIVISGAPGTDGEIKNQILHHTLGTVNYRYVRDMYEHVTSRAVTIRHAEDAACQIDEAFRTALSTRKPVYIEIPCNIATFTMSRPQPIQFSFPFTSDLLMLNAAVEHAASVLNSAKKPVLVAGVKLRALRAIEAFKELVDASHYPFAAMADAKGFISEQHKAFVGIYWDRLFEECTSLVESSDMCLFAGPLFTDYTMAGFSTGVHPSKLILASSNCVEIAGQTYTKVGLSDFLAALAKKIKPNDAALKEFALIRKQGGQESAPFVAHKQDATENQALTVSFLYARIQELLSSQMTILAETGDTWANAASLHLPEGCGFEIQLQYASIGWSIGATLGSAAATPARRVITLVGDGSFQMTAQEVSTIIRYQLNPIIIVVNNHGYLIENLIHEGPYNDVKNWKYSELVDIFNGEAGNGWGCRVTTEAELVAALEKAQKHDGLCLIEAVTGKNDCNKNSIEFGKSVAAFNKTVPKCG